ncbi:MAG: hypothetical protein Q7K42_03820, partial [Candidatus Diapherotrites archaeon]|nr:hypothetical protein [Candidatus Diapherotrites archaeon]
MPSKFSRSKIISRAKPAGKKSVVKKLIPGKRTDSISQINLFMELQKLWQRMSVGKNFSATISSVMQKTVLPVLGLKGRNQRAKFLKDFLKIYDNVLQNPKQLELIAEHLLPLIPEKNRGEFFLVFLSTVAEAKKWGVETNSAIIKRISGLLLKVPVEERYEYYSSYLRMFSLRNSWELFDVYSFHKGMNANRKFLPRPLDEYCGIKPIQAKNFSAKIFPRWSYYDGFSFDEPHFVLFDKKGKPIYTLRFKVAESHDHKYQWVYVSSVQREGEIRPEVERELAKHLPEL